MADAKKKSSTTQSKSNKAKPQSSKAKVAAVKTKASKAKASPARKGTTQTPKAAAKWFDWSAWQQLLNQAIGCWLTIFWRYVGVMLLSFSLQLFGILVFSGLAFWYLGGLTGAENLIANLEVGTLPDPGVWGGLSALFLGWLLYAIYIAISAKITVLAVIRGYLKKEKKTVLELFFQEGWARFWDYAWLSLLVFFYVLWPLLLGGLLLLGFGIWVAATQFETEPTWAQISLIAVGAIVAFGYVVYAAVRVLFAAPLLVHTKQSGLQAFNQARALTAGRWWYAALMWLLFVLLLYGVNILIELAASTDPLVLMPAIPGETEALGLVDLLAFFISVFMLAPITTAFQYLLMLNVGQTQGQKL